MVQNLEMSRFERDGSSQTKSEEPPNGTIFRIQQSKCVRNLPKVMLIFVVYSMGSVLFSPLKDPSFHNGLWKAAYIFKPFFKKDEHKLLLGSLLAQGSDENSCLSRCQAAVFYQKLQRKHPSSSSRLISRLRDYEKLHKKCGPYTESYNRTLEYLKSGINNGAITDCSYIIWIPVGGLGNKMITLVSTFLYALLTNRVLLVYPGGFIPDLFCEPFPEASWLLPSDFPIVDEFKTFYGRSPHSYGIMLRKNVFGSSMADSVPPYVYLHLLHDYANRDKLFFCDQEQTLLQKVPWLIIKSDNYFIPSLFLIQSFEEELGNLFPEKSAVFHLLARYLFHPTNVVWGLITSYYGAYLAGADEVTGIQIRTFTKDPGPFKHVLDQILACVRKENLLPEIKNKNKSIIHISKEQKTKAVLVTSLSSGYFEAIRDMYWKHQTATGDIIEVYQPSHAQYQQNKNKMHSIRALAEIYLLSLTDKLVTSPGSTFGYVAQSLGGLKPWILTKSKNQTVPDPPCLRALSVEPCFHNPPSHKCGRNRRVDPGKVVPHVQHCEDRSWGIKLVDRDHKRS